MFIYWEGDGTAGVESERSDPDTLSHSANGSTPGLDQDWVRKPKLPAGEALLAPLDAFPDWSAGSWRGSEEAGMWTRPSDRWFRNHSGILTHCTTPAPQSMILCHTFQYISSLKNQRYYEHKTCINWKSRLLVVVRAEPLIRYKNLLQWLPLSGLTVIKQTWSLKFDLRHIGLWELAL